MQKRSSVKSRVCGSTRLCGMTSTVVLTKFGPCRSRINLCKKTIQELKWHERLHEKVYLEQNYAFNHLGTNIAITVKSFWIVEYREALLLR